MNKFKVGESFKLKGCRKTWTVISTFNYKGERYYVAVSSLLNDPNMERLGIPD